MMSILTSNMKVTKIVQKHFLCTFWGFWSPSYVTSKLTSMCVNLIMSIYFFLWTSSIVHVFDFLTFDIILTTSHIFDKLTYFWQLDIFLTTWQLFDISPHDQHVVMCWIMCNSLNTAWIFTKNLLDIDVDVFYLNILWFFHNGLI